jgi:sphingomyelin phosphodiesterase
MVNVNTPPRKTLKVVHMSDPHIDLEYQVGALNKCDGYLCCRKENGFPADKKLQAGPWGGYWCDLPEQTLQSMLEHVRDVVKPDIMFWTGDNSPHDTYANTSD